MRQGSVGEWSGIPRVGMTGASGPMTTFPQLGAQVVNDGTVFTAYASETRSCRVGILDEAGEIMFHDMSSSGDGLFAAKVSGVGHGTLYQLWLDGQAYPDPYARYLPRGVHG